MQFLHNWHGGRQQFGERWAFCRRKTLPLCCSVAVLAAHVSREIDKMATWPENCANLYESIVFPSIDDPRWHFCSSVSHNGSQNSMGGFSGRTIYSTEQQSHSMDRNGWIGNLWCVLRRHHCQWSFSRFSKLDVSKWQQQWRLLLGLEHKFHSGAAATTR